MDERTVSKARMALATSGCPWIRAPSSNAPRGKMAVPYSFFSAPHAVSARSDPAQGRRHKTTRSTMGLSRSLPRSSTQIQAWLLHQTRPKSRSWAPASGSANVSSREVSKDRQRLRRFLSCLPSSKPDFSTPSSQFLSPQNHLFFPFPCSPLKAGCRFSHCRITSS